jgi:hypothetical protein
VTLALRKRNRIFSLHGVPMTGWLQYAASPSRRWLSGLSLWVLFCAGSFAALHAQTAGGSPGDLSLPTPNTSSTMVPRFTPAPAAPFTDANGLTGFSTNYGGLPGSASFKPSFDADHNAQFGLPRQNSVGQNPFGSFSPGGHRASSANLFTPDGRQANPLDRMTTPIELPSLTQALRKSATQPLGVYGPKSFNRDAAHLGGLFDDSGTHFSSSTMFTNSDLGNGVKFSAGTDFGSHHAAGAPAAGFGPSVGKTSGPSLAFKLSF